MKVIETEDLELRMFTITDVEALLALHSDPEVMRFSHGGPKVREEVLTFIHNNLTRYERDQFGQWAVILKKEKKLIGECGLCIQHVESEPRHEISYRLAPAYWGYGYATQAAKACLEFARDQRQLKSLIALIDPENARSVRVAEKLGMAYLKQVTFKNMLVHLYQTELN